MEVAGNAPKRFNIAIVVQGGRLQFEALLFLASLRAATPDFPGRVFLAEPQPGPNWQGDPRVKAQDIRDMMVELGGTFLPFENRHFGQHYPQGNKIEMLRALPRDEPFVFFDTDTLITGDLMTVPFDFTRPTASLRRENTWPKPELYGPGYAAIWKSLYDRFGLDFESSQDPSQPEEYWQRYLYFNAGWFFYECPNRFGRLFEDYAVAIRDNPPPELICQRLDPWLDQIALPLVIHALGGGRNTLAPGYLDGAISCHYRVLPLLYAREPDFVVEHLERIAAPNRLKKLLKRHEAMKRVIYQGRGAKARALFDQNNLPKREQAIRNRLKSEALWLR